MIAASLSLENKKICLLIYVIYIYIYAEIYSYPRIKPLLYFYLGIYSINILWGEGAIVSYLFLNKNVLIDSVLF